MADSPDRTWGADISCIRTAEGRLCLAVDLFSRRAVEWATSDSLKRNLAVRSSVNRNPTPGLGHPSNRGSQYCSGIIRPCFANDAPIINEDDHRFHGNRLTPAQNMRSPVGLNQGHIALSISLLGITVVLALVDRLYRSSAILFANAVPFCIFFRHHGLAPQDGSVVADLEHAGRVEVLNEAVYRFGPPDILNTDSQKMAARCRAV